MDPTLSHSTSPSSVKDLPSTTPPQPAPSGHQSSGLSRTQAAIGAWAKEQLPRTWWKVAVGSLVAWIVVNGIASGSPAGPILALDLLLGAALMPFCFLLYWYEECGEAKLPPTVLGLALVAGGTVGLVSGAVIEGVLAPGNNWVGAVIIGIAEEAAKALGVMLIARYAYTQVPHRLHGLLVGVAVGAGFAAVETLGYGLNSLLQAIQQVDVVSALAYANTELLTRMVLSPFGHVAWAGILGAAIWRERRSNAFVVDRSVVQAFGIVVVLHALWDGSLFANWPSISFGALSLPLFDTFIVGPLGLMTLAFFVYEVRQQQQSTAMPLPGLYDALLAYYRRLGMFVGVIQTKTHLAPAGQPVSIRAAAAIGAQPALLASTPAPTPASTPVTVPVDTVDAPDQTQAPSQALTTPAPAVSPEQVEPPEVGICPACGAQSAATAKFCMECGHALAMIEQP